MLWSDAIFWMILFWRKGYLLTTIYNILQRLVVLHPSKVLSQTGNAPFDQLPLQQLLQGREDFIENQYRKIPVHLRAAESVFSGELPRDATSTWLGIFKYQDDLGNSPY